MTYVAARLHSVKSGVEFTAIVRSKICFMSDHRPTTSLLALQQAPQYAAPAARRNVRVQESHAKSYRSCPIGTKLFLPDRKELQEVL